MIDTAVGWACGLVLMAPYPAFRALHLRHHARTNHPEDDPDMWVAATGPTLLWRCLTLLGHYYAVFLGPLSTTSSAARRARTITIVGVLGLLSAYATATAAGFGSTVLYVVVVPAWLAGAALAFLFDWLPHHPHTVQGRFRDTRVMPSVVLEALLLGQNLHLIHHLWPSVPFYRYGTVYLTEREALRAKGAAIPGPAPVPQSA